MCKGNGANGKKEKKLWEFVNSNIGILLIGATLTFFGTTEITNLYQQRAWKNDKACEIWKNELSQTQEIINLVTNLIKKRFYYSYLVLTTETNNAQYSEYFTAYKLTLLEWNTQLTTYRDNIANLLGTEVAYKILDKSNGRDNDNCLHCWFSRYNDVINLKNRDDVKFHDYMSKNEVSKTTGDMCDSVINNLNYEFRIKYEKYYKMIGFDAK